ncbi:MAG: hypothetical protein K0R18_1847 [Bacillales bacterium]|jgi:transcriptional regulator with XRE-family HTH domain|nr:hypothetical protein [Bacillales bacterium]
MKRGSAIKYTRTLKGLKQKELISKVHSKSLISRIENNDSEVFDGHYNYFIEKLEVDFPKLLEKEANLGKSLENLLTFIHYLQMDEAEKLLNVLFNQEDFIRFSDYYLKYKIIRFYYFVQVNNLASAENIWSEIQNQKENSHSLDLILADFFYSVFLIYKRDFKRANDKLSMILINENHNSINQGDLYFYVGRAKAGLCDYKSATFFVFKAAEYYNARFNYKRGILTAELLIYCHIYTEMYDEASKILEHLFRHKELLALLPNELPIIYHLRGTFYKKTGHNEQALDYYLKSLEFSQPIDIRYLRMQYDYSYLLFGSKHKKSKEQLSKLLFLSETLKNTQYQVLAKFLLLMLEDEKKAINYIEKKVIYLETFNVNREAKLDVFLTLFKFYRNLNISEKAIFYLEKWKEGKK